MTVPGVEPVQMCTSVTCEVQKLIGVKWNFCWRWHFQFMQHHPLEDSSWNKSHLEALMPCFLLILTRVEVLPILIWWAFSGVRILSCCCCSVTKLCPTLWGPMDCSITGFPVFHYLPEFVKFMCIESVKPSNYLILCHHLLPSVYPSIRILSNELALHITWPKYWSFSSSLPKNIQGWFPLELAVLISMLPKDSRVFSSTKASVFQCSDFLVKLSHPYITGIIVVLTTWIFVSKVMSLLSNRLSRFVIAFLPRSKHPLISWLQSPCSDFADLEYKIFHCFHFSPTYFPWSDGTERRDLSFLNFQF